MAGWRQAIELALSEEEVTRSARAGRDSIFAVAA